MGDPRTESANPPRCQVYRSGVQCSYSPRHGGDHQFVDEAFELREEAREARNALAAEIDRHDGGHSSALVDCAHRTAELMRQGERALAAIQADSNITLEQRRKAERDRELALFAMLELARELERTRAKVLEVNAEIFEHGYWHACSGCHESNEGHPTGPYSTALRCNLGNGCHECGGIGAVWEQTEVEPERIDDESRCAVCAWPLAESVEDGCVRGNCSLRPRPDNLYAPERAAKESGR